ncbi:MAG: glycine zipper 2TM domain-containing protein [Luteibacter sp.]|uniref:glycine zipper 2TM domain-containing protein n=1 Tax=Rhodanobacteraceae TaxID=1775411 RepID=UPI0005B9D80B|nr:MULTISPECIES: glycine zipper 2TM domain-containing protein [Rhodanobacteraceae]MDQ7994802.1 glycine zipper 2TM domain-containing protein [Luteibacter sp.]MDQ8049869.1 glycine zipper 2TM domain-containing protein [Luteibacter sp.]MDR6641344.1 outer membrane lipoprotein SlyB [Luteibacter sp. 1214]SDF59929.1 outer membrane lipoprotein SlyB [Dyella sp. 333MFSha]SKB59678.1 outer membrane lipoprotein SlyB [Luteibacter sp. 22Crub2.1]
MYSIVRKSGLVAAAVATLSLTACYEQPRRVYREDRVVYQGAPRGCEQCGVVDDVEQVYTQRDSSPLGAVIGAVAGGLLGNTIGKGDGRSAATVGGAVVGGVVGNQVGKRNGADQVAFRVSIRLDDGRRATVTQVEDPQLRRGDYVEVRGDRVYRR